MREVSGLSGLSLQLKRSTGKPPRTDSKLEDRSFRGPFTHAGGNR